MSMTPEQSIKHAVLAIAFNWDQIKTEPGQITADNVDDIFDEAHGDDYELQDAISEIRNSGEETDIPAPYSRHYESKSVAAKMPDGRWVGWTYWYGGGKHGEPDAIDWMDSAYFLDCKEEEKLVTVRTFTKAGA